MYHHIAPPQAVPLKWEPNEGWHFRHSPEGFERQLLALLKRGYRFITLAKLADDIHQHGVERPDTLVLTFDDGWVDNYTYAMTVLKKLSIPATFFVTSAHLYTGTDDTKKMNLLQMKNLLQAGMTIGGHTRTHRNLTKLPLPEARAEITGCKADLEQALSVEVDFFAYPGGAFNRQVSEAVRETGFTAACSVLSPAVNTINSLFWLFRSVLSERINKCSDLYRLTPMLVRLLEFRVRRRLRRQFASSL